MAFDELEIYGNDDERPQARYVAFGAGLVQRELERSQLRLEYDSAGDAGLQTEEDFEASLTLDLADDLVDVRRHLARFMPWQRQAFNQRLNASRPPQLLKPHLANGDDWADHLVGQTPDGLINFLEWHVDRTDTLNTDRLTAAVLEGYKSDYSDAVSTAVSHGRLPRQAVELIKGLDDADVCVGDAFDLDSCDRKGYGTIEDGFVTHEAGSQLDFNRLVTKGAFARRGFGPLHGALAEQISLGLINGDMTTFDPDERADGGDVVAKRRGLAAFATSGVFELDPQNFIDALVEPAGEAALDLYHQAWRAYPGTNPWQFYNTKYAMHGRQAQRQFHEAPPSLVIDSADEYARLSIMGLGSVKQQISPDHMYLEHLAPEAIAAERELDGLPPPVNFDRGHVAARMRAFSRRRAAEDFHSGTTFLQD